MAGSSARAAEKVAREERASASPDWESLPDIALLNVLQRVSSARSCAHFFVCKRWWSLAKEAQQSLDAQGEELSHRNRERQLQSRGRWSLLSGVLSRFRNLTFLRLAGWAATDVDLEALAAHCPRLLDLRLEAPTCPPGSETSGRARAGRMARGLGALTSLHSLFLHLPGIPLPAQVSSLGSLRSLTLVDAAGPLPDTLGALSSLTSLTVENSTIVNFHASHIIALPASLWQLTALEELAIVNLRLVDGPFPPDLGNLTALRRLTLRLCYTTLTTMSDGLTRLSSLEELDLHCPFLEVLPDGLHTLRKLRSLHLCAASIRVGLPRSLVGATGSGETLALEDLTLEMCYFALGGVLACLTSTLRRLEVHTTTYDLPHELGSLSRLEVLTLQRCSNVEALPGALGRCSTLRVLRVSGCPELNTLPEDIGDIPALRELHLSDLPSLTHLPQSLANAKELQQLTIDNCPRALPFPALLDLPRLDQESRRALRRALLRRSQRIASTKVA